MVPVGTTALGKKPEEKKGSPLSNIGRSRPRRRGGPEEKGGGQYLEVCVSIPHGEALDSGLSVCPFCKVAKRHRDYFVVFIHCVYMCLF